MRALAVALLLAAPAIVRADAALPTAPAAHWLDRCVALLQRAAHTEMARVVPEFAKARFQPYNISPQFVGMIVDDKNGGRFGISVDSPNPLDIARVPWRGGSDARPGEHGERWPLMRCEPDGCVSFSPPSTIWPTTRAVEAIFRRAADRCFAP